MHPGVRRYRIPTAHGAAHVVAELQVDVCGQDLARVAVPSPDAHLVVRFGPSLPEGVDVHALGARYRVHRKRIPGGRTALLARLRPGACEAVLGAPASALSGRIVPLEVLWGRNAAQRLQGGLADAPDARAAAVLLEAAIVRHAAQARAPAVCARRLHAAVRGLQLTNVGTAAHALGISERHLRRLFQQAFGMSPKAFARLKRFERALQAARGRADACWSGIAAEAGYYDQAHLIAEFRAIAGATPRRFLAELHATVALR